MRGPAPRRMRRGAKASERAVRLSRVAIPPIVFFGCFIVGIYTSTRWLPGLAGGTVGGLAFFAVCGLLALALAVVGLSIEDAVRAFEDEGRFGREILSGSLANIGGDAGPVFGLACVVYLLAPKRGTASQEASRASVESDA